eukprot:s2244_g15.t1
MSEIGELWKGWLEKMLKAKEFDDVVIKEEYECTSPLNTKLWAAWQRATKDPEVHVVKWARRGVALGMNKRIETCGIFPAARDENLDMRDAPPVELLENTRNYISCWPHQKQSHRGHAEERRQCQMLRARAPLAQKAPVSSPERAEGAGYEGGLDAREREDLHQCELVGADLADAFCHYPVCKEEIPNCICRAVINVVEVPAESDGSVRRSHRLAQRRTWPQGHADRRGVRAGQKMASELLNAWDAGMISLKDLTLRAMTVQMGSFNPVRHRGIGREGRQRWHRGGQGSQA